MRLQHCLPIWEIKKENYLFKKMPPKRDSTEAVLLEVFYVCALRRTFRLRAMGALSQVKVLNMPR